MKPLIEARAVKVEEVKDDKGVITYKVDLETIQTVNSLVKPELNKVQIFEVRHYDFTDKETGRRINGFKILGIKK